MAGQQGFLYEGRVFNKLKSKNLVPPGVKPAGANPNAPDAVFLYNNQPHNLEIKLDLATDFGQGTCLLYTSPSPRDGRISRMPSSA